jgi:hypothetical protein
MMEQILVERTFRFGSGQDAEEVTIEATTDSKMSDLDSFISIRNAGSESGVTITPKYLSELIVVLGEIQGELAK